MLDKGGDTITKKKKSREKNNVGYQVKIWEIDNLMNKYENLSKWIEEVIDFEIDKTENKYQEYPQKKKIIE